MLGQLLYAAIGPGRNGRLNSQIVGLGWVNSIRQGVVRQITNAISWVRYSIVWSQMKC